MTDTANNLADIHEVVDRDVDRDVDIQDDSGDTIKVAPLKTSILRPTLLLAGALAIVVVMKVGGPVLGPLFLFAFVALLVAPLFQILQKRGLSAGLSLVIMLAGIIGITLGLGLIILISFKQLLQGLDAYNQSFQINTETLNQWLQTLQIEAEALPKASDKTFEIIGNVVSGVLGNVVSLVTGSVIVIIGLSFIMLESASFSRRLQRGLKDETSVLMRMAVFQRSIFGYVIARIKLNLLTGIGIFVMLLIFRVDYALLWGVLAFLLSFVPYIGLFIAAVPAVLLGAAESGLVVGAILAIGYILINQIVEQVAEPKIMGEEMTISPTLMFLSVLFWMWVFGSLGAMIAGPLTALTIVVLGSFDDTRWLAILFSAEDSPLVTGEIEEADSESPDDLSASPAAA